MRFGMKRPRIRGEKNQTQVRTNCDLLVMKSLKLDVCPCSSVNDFLFVCSTQKLILVSSQPVLLSHTRLILFRLP